MKVNKLLLRQENRSIFRDEQCEILAVFEVDRNNVAAHVVLEQFVDKRDVENSWFVDNEAFKDLTQDDFETLDSMLWSLTPLHQNPTDAINAIRRNAYVHEVGR